MKNTCKALSLISMIALFSAQVQTAVAASAAPNITVPSAGKNANGFAPKGWRVEDKCEGDLNGDKLADLVMVLINGSSDNGSSAKRVLAIALKQPDNSYKCVAVGKTLLLGPSDGGMKGTAPELSIEKGVLSIVETGGGFDTWGVTLKFRNNAKTSKIDLIGFDYDETETNDDKGPGVSVSINLLTHQRIDQKSTENGNKILSNKKSHSDLSAPTVESFTWDWVEKAEKPPGKK